MSNYIFHPSQQEFHDNQRIDLGDLRVFGPGMTDQDAAKIIYNGNTLIDLTNDTVEPNVVINGYSFHYFNGMRMVGTYDPVDLNNDTVVKNVVINGYTFHAANGMQMVGNYQPIDLSSDTVTPSVVLNGYTFHQADNTLSIGTYDPPPEIDWSRAVMVHDPTNGNYIGSISYISGSVAANGVFNYPVTFGNNVKGCYSTFYNCINFQQDVIIPENVIDLRYMFYNCKNFYYVNIYVKSTAFTNKNNVAYMLYNTNYYNYRKNIYTNGKATYFTGTNGTYNSVTGTTISWSSSGSGSELYYYNKTYNIYIYNYIPAGI